MLMLGYRYVVGLYFNYKILRFIAMKNKDKSNTFGNFEDFYPFYLSQHQTLMCKRFHFLGTILVFLFLLLFLLGGDWLWLVLIPIAGYGFAWIGHYVYEKNRPATFHYPLYSLMGDFLMFWQILTGKIKIF